jgi:acetyl-CoA carboxylase biotin carboxyl carrier protein
MEIPVVSEAAGRVVEVAVKEGDVVQEGDLIAKVE